jgi:hypothetical protein
MLGINPVYFAGAVGPPEAFPLLNNRCNDIWARYSWQRSDSVSHYDFALEIKLAERDIANYLGWWPAPCWIAQEYHAFPRHHRRDAWRAEALNVRDQRIGLKTTYAKVISPGQRAATLVATATTAAGTLTYTDDDGDGFFETATVTVPTTLTNVREVKVFFSGYSGDAPWEIRPARARSISGGVYTAKFYSWQFIDPDELDHPLTSDGFQAVDLSPVSPPITIAPLVTTVDVYRIYNNTGATSAQFQWEPLPVVPAWPALVGAVTDTPGELTLQNGVFHIRDARLGTVVPEPATYANGTWTAASFVKTHDPDAVNLWYYAGDYGETLGSNVEDPLADQYARAILQIAVARLERPFCSCGNLTSLIRQWQADVTVMSNDVQVPQEDLDNPFGLHFGEILAWRAVRNEQRTPRRTGAI